MFDDGYDEDDDEMVYVIKDIGEFVKETRKIVFASFGKEFSEKEEEVDQFISELTDLDYEELDKTLSQNECINIVHHYVRPKVKTRRNKQYTRYYITDKIFTQIIEDFNSRLVSNLLTQLVNKGLIESSYDAEANDFIFWVKDTGDQK